MPGWDDGTSQNLSYSTSQPGHDYSSDYTTSILRSVKEQEAQFEKLTREFEADKLIAANQINRNRLDSETASLNSIRRELEERKINDPMESLQYADHSGYGSPSYNGSRSQVTVTKTVETRTIRQSSDYAPVSPAHDPYGGGDYAPHPYDSTPHSDYGSPHHSNYQDYPPSEDGQGYGYTEPPPPADQYNGYGSDIQPRDSYRDDDPRESLREDPYGTRDRYDGPGDEDPYRSPSVAGPDPYSTLPKTEDPYQSSPGYRDYTQTPPAEDPYVSTRQPYDEYQPDSRGHDPEVDERDPVPPVNRTDSHDPFVPPEHGDGKWRAPDLQEVIDYLGHPNQSIVAHAAGYIQHLSYQNDDIKAKTRGLGGIPPLVELLGNPMPEIHRAACGSLRNLSYGKQHEENKVAIKNAGGIPALTRLIRTTQDPETKELAAGTLWNLSSAEPIKKAILDDALTVLVNSILIPESGWKPQGHSTIKPAELPWTLTFRNATGCLRNISSAGPEARHRMRDCEGLVDSLVHVIKSAVHTSEMDNKVVENALCILRNLSFRIANEANHPDAVPLRQPSTTANKQNAQPKKAPNSGSLICFGGSKKKQQQNATGANGTLGKTNTWNPNMPIPDLKDKAKGAELLWQPSVLSPYLSILSECSNPVSLEAAAGTIQNVSAGEWQWAVYIRAEMRKEKGLPVLVELLRMENDRVYIAVAKALRNLAMDPRNKELIGKYGMQDLVARLPSGSGRRSNKELSHEGIVAILNTLHEVISKNEENAKSFRTASGIERLVSITKSKSAYPAAVVKAAYQVLRTLWTFKDLRQQYKKDGWEEHFFHPTGVWTSSTMPKKMSPVGSLPPAASRQANTLDTPVRSATAPPRHAPYEPSQPTRPAPEFNPIHEDPPPAFDDPYSTSSRHQPQYDERSVDRDYRSDDDLIARNDPYTRESISTINSQERLDDRAVQGEEIPMHNMGDYQEDPYNTTSNSMKRPPVGGVPVFGRPPEPQVDHNPYSSVIHSTSQDRYDDGYNNYSTAGAVQLDAGREEPAGDSWV